MAVSKDQYEKALADYNAAQRELGDIGNVLTTGVLTARPTDKVTYNGKTYTRAELVKLESSVQKRSNSAKKIVDQAEKFVSDTRKKIADIDNKLKTPETFAGQTPRQSISAQQKNALVAERKKLETSLTQYETGAPAAAPNVAAPAATPASAGQFRQTEQRIGTTAATPGTPAATGGATPSAGGAAAGVGGAGGGTGSSGAGTQNKGKNKNKGGKNKKTPPAQEWASIVQSEFGPLWDVYTSNADVAAVLDQAVQEGWFNDDTKLTEALRNTTWYKTTEQSARQFSIRQSTDPAQLDDEINVKTEELRQSALANGLQFDDVTLRRLATDNIKYGWSTQQATNALGSEAVAQAQAGGGRGVADLRSGYVGQNLRKIAQSYAQKPSEAMIDMWIQDIMTGKKTDVQWTDTMRESAKTQFRSLTPALDRGQDVETAMYAYKQQAQSILGGAMDVSQVDWTSDKWNKALNYRDEKTNEFRQMDLWEWNKYLRSLPEWQQTDEAKSTYSNIAYTLAQGFGKIA